ncbi:hypothetical protein U1Q18_031590 [Sarracenia purpurea var. burkii]
MAPSVKVDLLVPLLIVISAYLCYETGPKLMFIVTVKNAPKCVRARIQDSMQDIEEARSAFKALSESANVESNWTWEQAMRVIINDKRYGALKTLGERKQGFNEYLGQRKKPEAEERRVRMKKAREDFTKMLEQCEELTSSTRWSMFEDDERFKTVERHADREDLFKNYLVDLQKKVVIATNCLHVSKHTYMQMQTCKAHSLLRPSIAGSGLGIVGLLSSHCHFPLSYQLLQVGPICQGLDRRTGVAL